MTIYPKWVWSGSRALTALLNFWVAIDNISEMVQDIVAVED